MSRNCGCNRGNDDYKYKLHHKKYRSHRKKYKSNKKYVSQYKYKSNKKYHKKKYSDKTYTKSKNHIKYGSHKKSDLRSWTKIHTQASEADTNELKNEFENYIIYLGNNFPCPKCRPHIKTYMRMNPIKGYYNMIEDGKDIGMAKWSWEFHNNVSNRLGKSTVSWNDFSKKYL